MYYCDPTVKCCTQEFIKFAAIAGSVLGVIINFFANNSSHCVPHKTVQKVFHPVDFTGGMFCTFVESFQGQYKDGTNGSHDFRMVLASFLHP